jgi:hypothetical protein
MHPILSYCFPQRLSTGQGLDVAVKDRKTSVSIKHCVLSRNHPFQNAHLIPHSAMQLVEEVVQVNVVVMCRSKHLVSLGQGT